MMMNRWLGAMLWAISAGIPGMPPALSQTSGSTVSDCLPPAANEYLLFAVTKTLDTQTLLRSKAPTDATTMLCTYQGNLVTRVGGFGTEPSATAWGQYLIRTTGIGTTIVRPAPVVTVPLVTAPDPKAVSQDSSKDIPKDPSKNLSAAGSGAVGNRFAPGVYNPQVLNSGYVVLVNYNNRPEVAVQLRQALSQDIGVAVYGERPYLFVMQTSELSAANAVVKLLSDQGFLAMRVEAKSVVLLRTIKN